MTDSKLRETVSTNIKSALDRNDMSVDDLATGAEVSRSQIYEVVHGRANLTLDRLGRIASVLKLDAWRLLVPRGNKKSKR